MGVQEKKPDVAVIAAPKEVSVPKSAPIIIVDDVQTGPSPDEIAK